MAYYGTLICRERLRRNWSQEGLCKGVCTVSYLSKIEKGKAEPSDAILRMLLARLGIHTDAHLDAEAGKLAEDAYELLFSGCAHAFKRLLGEKNAEDYRAASAGLDILLLARFASPDMEPLDAELEACMEPKQLALQRILQGRHEEAILLLPNAYTRFEAGAAAYESGNYTAASEYLEMGYGLAAREGSPHLMLMCRMLIGNSYCNQQDLDNMLKHYAVAKRLATAVQDEDALEAIAYNTASARIEAGHYEEAYAYFSAQENPGLMALHKLAICCEKTGRREEAVAALDKADTMESEYPATGLARELCALVRYRLEHPDYLEHEEYGSLLIACFEACKRDLPLGYASFHMPWVLEWLTAARQYKRAYELLRDFPAKHN